MKSWYNASRHLWKSTNSHFIIAVIFFYNILAMAWAPLWCSPPAFCQRPHTLWSPRQAQPVGDDVRSVEFSLPDEIHNGFHVTDGRALAHFQRHVSWEEVAQGKEIIPSTIDPKHHYRTTFSHRLAAHLDCCLASALEIQGGFHLLYSRHFSVHAHTVYDYVGATVSQFFKIEPGVVVVFEVDRVSMPGYVAACSRWYLTLSTAMTRLALS